MLSAVTLGPQAWWYLARASGIVSWAAADASVLLGLGLATRALGDRPRPAWLLDLHRFASGVALVALAGHLGALVADSYVHFGLADLVVPFASGWKSGAVAWGILAFWLLALVEVSSLLRARLSKRTWHRLHLTSYLAAAASTAHALTAGTDRTNPWFVGLAVVLPGAVAYFLVYRLVGPRRRRGRAAAGRPRPVPPSAPEPDRTLVLGRTDLVGSAPATRRAGSPPSR